MVVIRKAIFTGYGGEMNIHQQIEDLIFSGKSLTSAEQTILGEHLNSCPGCNTLYHSWKEIHAQIQYEQVIYPSANFIENWNLLLDNRKIHASTMQARRMLLFSLIGTVLALLVAIALTIVLTSPADLIIGLVKSLNSFILFINLINTFSTMVFEVIPLIIPFYYTLVITSTFCLLTLLWVFSIWRLSKQGVMTE
jgi:hypothetical protein